MRFFKARSLPFIFLALMAVILVAATAYEHLYGTSSAMQVFYHSWWFVGLWGLIAVAGTVKAIRSRSCRRPAVMSIHIALLIILAGALTTHLSSNEGTMSLRKHQPATNLFLQTDNHIGHLPFLVSADSITIELNRPMMREGYILYLMNRDKDEAGCTLKVVKDPYGFPLTHIGYILLLLGFIAFLIISSSSPKGESPNRAESSPIGMIRGKSIRLSALLLLIIGSMLYAYRGYLAGHIPLTNGGEVWHFCALCAFALALWLRPAPCLVVGALALGISFFSTGSLTAPSPPVLRSFWLSLHVSIIILAYTLLAYLAVVPSHQVLKWAVATLAVGIFLGAAWAGQAWGRYWGWDPKEVWALITLLVYVLPLHKESLPWFRGEKHLRWYLRLAFICVLFTYFGVNYLMGGLHSYAV